MLVIVIANSQGVHEYLSPDRLACLQEGLLPLDGVGYHDPSGHDLPPGGTFSSQYARFTPRFRLPKSFPDTKPSAGQPQVPGPRQLTAKWHGNWSHESRLG